MTASAPRYRTVVFDVDSTLTGIEGVDWLAAQRAPQTLEFVGRLTERVMAGELPIEDAYGVRLEHIAPTRDEVRQLAAAYRDAVAPDARTAITALAADGVRVLAVSGGIREAVVPFCTGIGISQRDIHAVSLMWDRRGKYQGFDAESPLVTQRGKATLLSSLALPRPILAVGDGSTDIEMRRSGEADAFAAYTGFTHRARVVEAADFVVSTFAQLVARVLTAGR